MISNRWLRKWQLTSRLYLGRILFFKSLQHILMRFPKDWCLWQCFQCMKFKRTPSIIIPQGLIIEHSWTKATSGNVFDIRQAPCNNSLSLCWDAGRFIIHTPHHFCTSDNGVLFPSRGKLLCSWRPFVLMEHGVTAMLQDGLFNPLLKVSNGPYGSSQWFPLRGFLALSIPLALK